MNNSLLSSNHTAFKLKSGFFSLSVLQLIHSDIGKIAAQLQDICKQAPHLFNNTPLLLDLAMLSTDTESLDFVSLIRLLRSYHLIPTALINATAEQTQAAIDHGLAILQNATATPQNTNIKITETKLITSPVRSGQKIYAQAADLIILNSVSPGAEILADGHIHVYGTLRGRAFAGVNGNENARIFCQALEAELICIAGCYMLHEQINPPQPAQAMQIYLHKDHLKIAALN